MTRTSKFRRLFAEDAVDGLLEIALLCLSFATGILDAAIFPRYGVFVANQTGNTVLLAVGALNPPGNPVNLRRVGVSLGFFIAGGFIFGRIGLKVGPRRRAWLATSTTIQAALDATAATLAWAVAMPEKSKLPLAVIALLSFSGGGQVSLARTVKIPEITTAVVTSAYTDILTDPKLFQWNNRARDRRIGFLLVFIGGAFVGAASYAHVSVGLPILITAAIKLAMTLVFLFTLE